MPEPSALPSRNADLASAVLVPSAKLISAADAARPPRRLPEPATMPAIGIRPRPPNIPHAKSKGIAVEGRPAAVSNESEAGVSGGRRREGECVCTLMRSDTGQQKRRGGRNYRLTHRYPFPSIQSRPPAQALGPRAGQSILSDFTKSSTGLHPSGTLIAVPYSARACRDVPTLSRTEGALERARPPR